MKGMNRLAAAAVLAGLTAFGLGLSTARLEAKGKGNGSGDISAVCATLLDVINNTSLPQAIRDVAQAGYDALGCNEVPDRLTARAPRAVSRKPQAAITDDRPHNTQESVHDEYQNRSFGVRNSRDDGGSARAAGGGVRAVGYYYHAFFQFSL